DISRRGALDLVRVAVERELGLDQGNRLQTWLIRLVGSLRRATEQDIVPVDLQIRGHANLLSARRKLTAEVGSHSAGPPSGETQIIYHTLPLSIRAERFHVRRDGLQLCLRGSIHAVRREVLD